jgi:hypothetical protein
MNDLKLNRFMNLLFAGVLILLIFAYITISKGSLSSSSAGNPYPEPNIDLIPSTPTETICDKWYSFFEKLPSDQQAMVQHEYQKCLEAVKTPPSLRESKPLPATPKPIKYESSLIRRKAGFGTIVETGFSPFPLYYLIKNQWYSDQTGKRISVYAGALRGDPSLGGKSLGKPLPGLLIVEVDEPGGKIFADERGEYWTPEKVGPVRIVDAEGMNIYLAAEDGTNFIFDVSTRQFVSSETNSPISRAAGVGVIIESGKVPFPVDGYTFTNYWTETKPETGTIFVLAGAQSNDLEKGAVVILLSPLENKCIIVEEAAYLMSIPGYPPRVAEADGELLTFVTDGGSTYKFDVSTRQFIFSPGAMAVEITVIPIHKTFNLLTPSPVRTPTRTPTVSPTITAVPTSNPYP